MVKSQLLRHQREISTSLFGDLSDPLNFVDYDLSCAFHAPGSPFPARLDSSPPFSTLSSCISFFFSNDRCRLVAQTLPDVQGPQVRVHANGGVSGRRGVDAAPGPPVFRRQRGVFRDGVRDRGARLLARRRRGVQGSEAGEPVIGPRGIRETGQYKQTRTAEIRSTTPPSR